MAKLFVTFIWSFLMILTTLLSGNKINSSILFLSFSFSLIFILFEGYSRYLYSIQNSNIVSYLNAISTGV